MRVEIKGNIVWQVQRTGSGRMVAVCDALGLTLEGDNDADLVSMIGEGMHELFADLHEDGELQQFLIDRGWNMSGPPIPRGMPEGGLEFDAPYKMEPATGGARA